MEEPILYAVIGISAALVLAWAIQTRQSRWQVRQGFLYWAGALVVFVGFLFVALSYFPGPDWFWCLVGFAGYFGMCFLIHQKFDGLRI
jgi:uncharacterized membrane protein YuzA (DUF378 family)